MDIEKANRKVKGIYLDNNASTIMDAKVLKVFIDCLHTTWGNPSNTFHKQGRASRNHLELAREKVASFLNCERAQVVFTSGATEANHMAIRSGASISEVSQIVTTNADHPSVFANCIVAEESSQHEIEVEILPIDESGSVSVEAVRNIRNPKRTFASIIWVNNETGAIAPIHRVVEILKNAGAVVHVDATQAAGKIPIDLMELNCDMLTISAHKMHGPLGVGALFVRKPEKFTPTVYGGGQEFSLRSGTENVPGIVAFGMACDVAKEELEINNARIVELNQILIGLLRQHVPTTIILNKDIQAVPHTVLCAWPGIENEELLSELDLRGIMAGSGSACSTRVIGSSKVLAALGVSSDLARSAVRFSLGKQNNKFEIEETVRVLTAVMSEIY